jgi:PPOX class probable F420-dependent enzyme
VTANHLNPTPYVDQRTVLLTSFKRDGTPVGTPVHIAVDGGRIYFRSYEKAWKTKRIRSDPRVEIAPSTIRGAPTGPAVSARARILDSEEEKIAKRAIARKYPIFQRWIIPWAHKLMGTNTVHFEVLARNEPGMSPVFAPESRRARAVPEPAGRR